MIMTEPDFDQWAHNIYLYYSIAKVAEALKQSYEQGYHLGKREGYEVGLEQGWAIEQDNEISRERQRRGLPG
jgi:flagellar biosynthesis/type III secretory pathway protein FliH